MLDDQSLTGPCTRKTSATPAMDPEARPTAYVGMANTARCTTLSVQPDRPLRRDDGPVEDCQGVRGDPRGGEGAHPAGPWRSGAVGAGGTVGLSAPV